MKQLPHEHEYREIPLTDIQVRGGRRSIQDDKVAELVKSIQETGLLQPIGVTEDLELVFGAHRLEACKRLGRKEVLVRICRFEGDLQKELAEIDENLQRANLTHAEETKALARRKKIYEELHPETRQHVAGGKASGAKRRGQKGTSDNLSFVQDTAAKTDKSGRAIEREVRTGQQLDDEAVALVATTPVANKKGQIDKLSKQPPEQQRKIAAKIVNGEAATVDEAISESKPTDAAKYAKAGLQGLDMLESVLKSLGLFDVHAEVLGRIREDLRQRVASADTTASTCSQPASSQKNSATKNAPTKTDKPAVRGSRKGKSVKGRETVTAVVQEEEPTTPPTKADNGLPQTGDSGGKRDAPKDDRQAATPSKASWTIEFQGKTYTVRKYLEIGQVKEDKFAGKLEAGLPGQFLFR